MTVISIRIDTQEDKLIKENDNTNNISETALFRNTILGKNNLDVYNQDMTEDK